VFLINEEGEEGEDEASASEEDESRPAPVAGKKRKRVANKIYIDEVMERARRLVVSHIFYQALDVKLDPTVALAHASYLETTHLLFKKPLSSVSSRNGMRLRSSYARRSTMPSRNMSKNSYTSISMILDKAT